MRPSSKLLFVDDEPHVLSAINRQLGRDFEIVTACGPEEGLAAVRSQGPFAVVVADMQMPGMDGITFLHMVQHMQPDAIRMMLTGNADEETQRCAVAETAIFKLLNKPCSYEDLRAAILEALALRNSGEAA